MTTAASKQTMFPAASALGALPLLYLAFGCFDIAARGWRAMDTGAKSTLAISAGVLAALLFATFWPGFRRFVGSRGKLKLWFILLGLVVPLGAIELISGVYLRHRFRPDATYTTDRLNSPLYAGFNWAEELIRTAAQVTYRYAPFRLWAAGPLQSRLMNVNAEGARATFEPPQKAGAPEYRVQVYGGSTVFCMEVPDAWTLPSCIAQKLAERLPGYNITVENCGVPSYLREQEAIWFGIKTREKPPPDLAIFYDGGNDLAIRAWLELPHKNLERFEEAMRGTDIGIPRLASTFFLSYTNLGRLVDAVRKVPAPPPSPPGAREISTRAENAARDYCDLADQLRKQAAAQGIATAFFLQPTLYDKPFPTAREKFFLDYEFRLRPGLEKLRTEFHDRIVGREAQRRAETGLEDFFDLSALFDSRRDDVYFDVFHVGPRENEAIAAEIVRRLDSRLPRS